jgi:hypothetical protein
MKSLFTISSVVLAILGANLFTGCGTTSSGTSSAASYNTGFNDPWLYGDAIYNDGVIIGPPPADRPPAIDSQPRPEQPIALPPAASMPRPTPMPSIPSAPMGAPRGGRR